MLFAKGALIVSRYVAEFINQLIAGLFGHVGDSFLFILSPVSLLVGSWLCLQLLLTGMGYSWAITSLLPS